MEELQQRVDAAVREAERATSGEVVPVLARASGDYRAAEARAAAAGALVLLAAGWLLHPEAEGDWGQGLAWAWLAGWTAAGLVAGWGGAWALPAFKRLFVSRRSMRAEVESAAHEALALFRVRRTAGATGVLIYVSVFERLVRIQGDAAIARAGIDWTGVCDAVVAELKAGRLDEAFVTGIARAGAILAGRFPAGGENPDELHNGLRVLE